MLRIYDLACHCTLLAYVILPITFESNRANWVAVLATNKSLFFSNNNLCGSESFIWIWIILILSVIDVFKFVLNKEQKARNGIICS